jgi:23S rRNA U2552 (ribose-2'-O)-methylase RlmE/FtsJ
MSHGNPSFRKRNNQFKEKTEDLGWIPKLGTREELEAAADKMYLPTVYTLPDISAYLEENPIGISKKKRVAIFSGTLVQPQLIYGFHYYNYATREKLADVTQIPARVYHITNPYEHRIDSKPESSIETHVTEFLKIGVKNRPAILSRGFYKLWELMVMFKLVPLDGIVRTVHLAEGPGSFIQAVLLYRETYGKSNKRDVHYGITLHSDDRSVPELEAKFMTAYGDRVQIHPTKSLSKIKPKSKDDNGDLTRLSTLQNLYEANKGKDVPKETRGAVLVTADGGMNWENESMQEQESYVMIFGQITAALMVLREGGNFVIKFYDIFTPLTVKYLILLKMAFEEVHVTKPFMSRCSNAERYIVCKNYNLASDKRDKLISDLVTVLQEWEERRETDFNKLQDIYDHWGDISADLYATIVALNTEIARKQIIAINRMIHFNNLNNYYGDEYQEYCKKQIEASTFWISKFMPAKLEEVEKYMKIQDKLLVSEQTNRKQMIIREL